MTSKSSKNFYLFGGVSIAIFVGYVLYASTDVPTEAMAATTDASATETPKAATEQAATTAETTTDAVAQIATKPAAAASPMRYNSFIEGTEEHYITKFPNDTMAKEPVLVEFFSYMCPHCYRLEGTIKRWEKNHKPADVKFIKIPVRFSGNALYAIAAEAHYIAEKLGLLETFPDRMFKRIHIDRRPLRNDNDMASFFAEFGVSRDDFTKAKSSFEVQSKLRRGDALTRKYQVSGVPYLLVNYKYEIGKKAYESEQSLFDVWTNLPYKGFK